MYTSYAVNMQVVGYIGTRTYFEVPITRKCPVAMTTDTWKSTNASEVLSVTRNEKAAVTYL